MDKKLDVVIGLPSHDGTYHFQMWNCYEYLVDHSTKNGLAVGRSKMVGSLLPNMRCYLADQALERQAGYLLFIDADMVFPRDGLIRLIDHGVDIVSGLYFKKKFPHNPVASIADEAGKLLPISEWPQDELIDNIDACGSGFLLIKTDVLRKLSKPWFFFYECETANELMHGEDFGFCKKAKEAGYLIHLDTGLLLRHIGPAEFGLEHYIMARDMQEKSKIIHPASAMEN